MLGSQRETPAPPIEGSHAEAAGTRTRELVAAVRAGDAAAREALFVAHAGTVRRALGRALGRDPELGDLLHDVFVAALEGIDQLEQPEALAGWLSQIAVNVARAHVRRRVRQRALTELLGWLPQRRAHLDHQASEAALIVRELVAHLPASQRTPLLLRFLAELQLSEVARTSELSVPTVKRRLKAARRRLARLHEAPRGCATSEV